MKPWVLGALVMFTACMPTRPPPELATARAHYARAHGDRTRAKLALDAAEVAFQSDDPPKASTFAYVADRELTVAEAEASTAQLRTERRYLAATCEARRQMHLANIARRDNSPTNPETSVASRLLDIEGMRLERSVRGLHVFLGGDDMFLAGSLAPERAGILKLHTLMTVLRGLTACVTVIGHADAGANEPSELGDARAGIVQSLLIDGGIEPALVHTENAAQEHKSTRGVELLIALNPGDAPTCGATSFR